MIRGRQIFRLFAAPALAFLLTACVAPGDEALTACNAEPAQFVVGESYSDRLAAEAMAASGAAALRRIAPGQAVTMDFRSDRLNLETDRAGRIAVARCG